MNFLKNQPSNSGAVLLLTLITVAVIMAIVVQLHFLSSTMIKREQVALELSRMRLLASDAAWYVINRLASDEMLLYDHTNKLWTQPYMNAFSDGTKVYAFAIDENRFFDVNNLGSREKFNVLRKPIEIAIDLLTMNRNQNAIDVAQSIKDWVDADFDGPREASFYIQKGFSNIPPNLPMESSKEMEIIFQANGVIFPEMPEGLTVVPRNEQRITKVNINTASENVLAAMLVPYHTIVSEICRRRNASPILSLDEVFHQKIIGEAKLYFDVKSEYFSIFAQAEKEKKLVKVYALVKRDANGNVKLIRWIE